MKVRSGGFFEAGSNGVSSRFLCLGPVAIHIIVCIARSRLYMTPSGPSVKRITPGAT
jgi:hypothetical protein